MLLSVGIALPKTIFAHGWWLTGDDKMSKSKGNVINPMDLIDVYGVDPVRYYLMREMVLGQDANFTVESFNNRYNSDLANDFGNLLSSFSLYSLITSSADKDDTYTYTTTLEFFNDGKNYDEKTGEDK